MISMAYKFRPHHFWGVIKSEFLGILSACYYNVNFSLTLIGESTDET